MCTYSMGHKVLQPRVTEGDEGQQAYCSHYAEHQLSFSLFFFFPTVTYLLSVRWQLQGAGVKEEEGDGTIIKE